MLTHVTAVALDSTPSLCILCPGERAKIARPGGQTDWDCHERLIEQLGEVAERFLRLSARPGNSGEPGRRAPGFGSRPPLNMHIAALRDPRTAPAELGDPHAPLNFLITWSNWIRTERRQDRVRYDEPTNDAWIAVYEHNYLVNAMDWMTRQFWVTTFATQLRIVLGQLRAAGLEPNPRPLGQCTTRNDDDIVCGNPLWPPNEGGVWDLRCQKCGTEYKPLDQLRLKIENDRATGTCALCGHTDSQHCNDSDEDGRRACNGRWCICGDYIAEAPAGGT